MASESVATSKDREFFKFSGTYNMAPGTTVEDMVSDAATLLDVVDGMTGKLVGDFDEDVSLEDQSMIWGIRHLVKMALNLCITADEKLSMPRQHPWRGSP